MSESKYITVFKPWLAGRPGSDGECRAYCINCEDPRTSKSPSASFNFKAEVWHCMSCGRGGTFKTLARILKERGDEPMPAKDGKVIPIKGKPLPTDKQLRLWHRKLMGTPRIKERINDQRGLTDETLKRFMIGWDGQRYTIPIYGEDGKLVNVRRYKPNARDHAYKMISWAQGYGEARIDGFDILAKHDEVFLSEGELDRRIAVQNGIPAVGHTGGAKTFKMEWAKHFKGKTVYVCYDEDAEGDQGADKVAKVLKETAEAVYRLKLGTGIKRGDLTDFFVKLGHTGEDLIALKDEASPLFVQKEKHVVPTKGKPVTVEESKNPNIDGPIEVTAMVSGILDPPYYAPKRVLAHCDQNAGPKCSGCPLMIDDGKREVTLDRDDARVLEFLDKGQEMRHRLLVKAAEAHCQTHIEFDELETWPVEAMSITPSVAHRSEKTEPPTARVVYNVGTYRTPVNHLARIVGKSTADPRSQRALFMGWQLEQVETDLEKFRMSDTLKKRLKKFQVAAGQKPLDKCVEIAQDLAANVTQIYGRDLLHVAYDLTWHSLTSFVFEGSPITKGWLDMLVIGDTRTGKSETAAALIKHYNSGVLHSMENTSYAGLIGGATRAGNDQWMVTWGLLPLNDRRLVVLDEMSGLFTNNRSDVSKGIIEGMSSVRSEGKAQVNKIASGEASARTRLIWISNPRSSMSLAESSKGCLDALTDLVRNPEDIARYDFVMAAASNDVPSSVINSTKHRKVKHRYTAKDCQALVMWAWSRNADDVKFLKGVEESIYAAAEDLGSRYIPDPPLVQIANVRVKVARLAVAIAARTFSTDSTGTKVVVKRTHVRAAVDFLDAVYGEQAMGYQRHSVRETENRKRAQKYKEEAREYLENNPAVLDVLMAIGGGQFKKRDFEEFGGLDNDESSAVIKSLTQWQMIQRKDKGYMVMRPALIELVRELEDQGD
jgi:hypothetical protein